MDTTWDTYKLHEERCSTRIYTCKPCKNSGFKSAHKTQDITACIWNRSMKAKATADRQAMQRRHNKEFIADVNRRIWQVGGDTNQLLKLAEGAWQDIFSLERYLAYTRKLNVISGKLTLSYTPPYFHAFTFSGDNQPMDLH